MSDMERAWAGACLVGLHIWIWQKPFSTWMRIVTHSLILPANEGLYLLSGRAVRHKLGTTTLDNVYQIPWFLCNGDQRRRYYDICLSQVSKVHVVSGRSDEQIDENGSGADNFSPYSVFIGHGYLLTTYKIWVKCQTLFALWYHYSHDDVGCRAAGYHFFRVQDWPPQCHGPWKGRWNRGAGGSSILTPQFFLFQNMIMTNWPPAGSQYLNNLISMKINIVLVLTKIKSHCAT